MFGTKYCSVKCSSLGNRKIKNRPSKTKLEEMLKTMSYTKIAKEYKISDNAVRKWAKLYKIIS